jgi:anti-sigma regulatory factor (Ser/Thr protein kinase)
VSGHVLCTPETEGSLILNYVIPSQSDYSLTGRAGAKLKSLLEKQGIEEDVVTRVTKALYEAETNASMHGGGGTAEVALCPDKICIRVKDNGPGIPDVSKAMEKGFTTASDEMYRLGTGAGMGLFNIKENSDFLEITSASAIGTEVYMEFRKV